MWNDNPVAPLPEVAEYNVADWHTLGRIAEVAEQDETVNIDVNGYKLAVRVISSDRHLTARIVDGKLVRGL